MSRSDDDARAGMPGSRSDARLSPECPTNVDILLLALDPSDETARQRGDANVAHVQGCEQCRARLQSVRAVLAEIAATTAAAPSEGAACLDDAELAEIADFGLSRTTRERRAHLVGCAHCREALASLAQVLADDRVARERSALDTTAVRVPPKGVFGRRAALGAGALAAAAVVALMVRPTTTQSDATHRAPIISAVEAPAPTTPAGTVANARVFRWTPVAGADRYRLTLFDAAGRVLYESERNDTVLTLPDSVALGPSQTFLWKIEARTAVDRWTSSDLIDFQIVRATAPPSP